MLILLLACAASIVGLAPPAPQVREETHRKLGVSLAVPVGFERAALPAELPWVVLRYVERGGEVSVFRFDRTQPAQSQSAQATDFEDFLALGVKNGLWEIRERKDAGARESWTYTEYVLARSAKLPLLGSVWAFELRSPACTWGLLGLFRAPRSADWIRSWRSCAEQMRFFEPVATPSPERKHWQKHYKFRPHIRNPEHRMAVRSRLDEGWAVADTENFLFVDNTRMGILMRHLQRKLEGIRRVYAELFPPTGEITAVATVRVCKDRDEYLRYGGARNAAGHWNPAREELVLYEAGREDSLRTLYHEAFHQYVHHAIGELQPHYWYNEGYGDYFGGARFTDEGEITRIQPNPLRLRMIQEAIRAATHASWSEMIRLERSAYYGPKAGIHYAMGWSMVYFLEESEVVAKHDLWSQILAVYFDALKESAVRQKAWLPATLGILSEEAYETAALAREHALEAAFMGVDLDELEAAWREFILARRVPR